jgi:hypothetical protein
VDLIIPNEQYLYLKALDYKERQKWLVALASQKASSANLNNIMNSNPKMSASGEDAVKFPPGSAGPGPDLDFLIRPGIDFYFDSIN